MNFEHFNSRTFVCLPTCLMMILNFQLACRLLIYNVINIPLWMLPATARIYCNWSEQTVARDINIRISRQVGVVYSTPQPGTLSIQRKELSPTKHTSHTCPHMDYLHTENLSLASFHYRSAIEICTPVTELQTS